ncbi:hypothetical protein JOH51_003654 [Rhizobium leguminosarum]|nr:hypothetical protein [Rhizobium leguminosarum]
MRKTRRASYAVDAINPKVHHIKIDSCDAL